MIRTYRQYRTPSRAVTWRRSSRAGWAADGRAGPGLIGRTWELTLDLLDARPLPEARRVLRLLASLADAPVPFELLLYPATLATSPPFQDITGSQIWHALKALDDFGLIDMDTSGPGPAAIRVARLHPLVRDTSRPAAEPERLAYLELSAKMLQRAADDETTGEPENPLAWPAWQLLAPHIAAVSDRLRWSQTVRTTRWERQRSQRTWRPAIRQCKDFTLRPRLGSGTYWWPGCGCLAPITRTHWPPGIRSRWKRPGGALMPQPKPSTGTYWRPAGRKALTTRTR